MRTIALVNQKGGSGKTTSAINIGAGLTLLGKKVLLVDLDPQSHLSYGLGIQAHELERTIYHLLKGEATLTDIWIERGELTLIPSSQDLWGAEAEFSGVGGREFLVSEALEEVKGFDYVLMDCPPSLGLLTLNALTAAQEVFIPVQTEFFALQGMSQLGKTVVDVKKKRLNIDLRITGVIAIRFDGRKRLNREVVEKIKEHFGDSLFTTLIRDNVALAEAPSCGKTIFEYSPKSHGAQDYVNLSKEILERGKKYDQKDENNGLPLRL